MGQKAKKKSKIKQFQSLIEHYEAAINQDPKDEVSWYNLSYIYNEIEEYDKAKDCYETILKINPQRNDVRKKIDDIKNKNTQVEISTQKNEIIQLLDGNDYDTILKKLLAAIPEVICAIVNDKNGYIIASAFSKNFNIELNSFSLSSAVVLLSAQKLINFLSYKEIEQFHLRSPEGFTFILKIDENRNFIILTKRDIMLGLFYLDCKRITQRLKLIEYKISQKKLNLEKKLQEIEDEFQERYKFFFSYAKEDSERFKIKELSEYLEKNFQNAEIMYFEKSKTSGEDILDYMERGVNWCNVFVWFHSKESVSSQAVEKEYKMAMYLGKNIISITEDFNALPLSARVTWSLKYNPDVK
jgi:predicted regulator of Ras-like GTPase activity (Roadblock/LC7/MglB family)